MEQNLILKIMLALMKERAHVRSLAKKMNINHMTVSRVLKYLMNENAIDYTLEGKNKVYFVKKTHEARNILIMAESANLNIVLSKYPRIRKIVTSMQANKNIKLVILFGSYAKGIPKDDSDIDIYLETKSRRLKNELSTLDSKLSIKIGKFDTNNILIKEIIKNHTIIKGVETYYEKIGFF